MTITVPTGSGTIYCIKNIVNGKCYIGMTISGHEKRWREHQADARRGCCYPLHCAIRKYGNKSFVVTSLETVFIDKLADAEIKWISACKSRVYENGYNIASGGNGFVGNMSRDMREKISRTLTGHVLSEDTKRKISSSLMGKKLSEETKAKIKVSLAKQECIDARRKSRIGKIHTEETKQKISLSSKKMWDDDVRHIEASNRSCGSSNPRTNLSEKDIVRIRSEWLSGGDKNRSVDKETCNYYADLLCSTPAAIFRIIRGHSWKHVIVTNNITQTL